MIVSGRAPIGTYDEYLAEADMNPDPQRKVEEIASDLDDLATTVEELQIDPSLQPELPNLHKLEQALDNASDATDALDQQLEDRTDLDDH